MTRSWREIWEARQLDPTRPSLLAQLMAADGLDSGFGNVGEEAWRRFVDRVGARLGVTPQSSVFEVGCGAGAFVYPWYEAGCAVGGLDASATLLGFAAQAMPRAQLTHAEAAALDPTDPVDFVISCGVFLYFPSLEYARDVLAKMVAKARCAVAVLDVADAAKQDEAREMRRKWAGEAEYEEKYRGLDHLFIDRAWVAEELRRLGMSRVEVEDQSIADYGNAAFRYNVFAWR